MTLPKFEIGNSYVSFHSGGPRSVSMINHDDSTKKRSRLLYDLTHFYMVDGIGHLGQS